MAEFAAWGRSAHCGIVGSVDHWIEVAAHYYFITLGVAAIMLCNRVWVISRNWFKLGAFSIWFLCLGSYFLDRNRVSTLDLHLNGWRSAAMMYHCHDPSACAAHHVSFSSTAAAATAADRGGDRHHIHTTTAVVADCLSRVLFVVGTACWVVTVTDYCCCCCCR